MPDAPWRGTALTDGASRIAFLLGKPVRGTSVISDVIDRVRGTGADVAVHVVTRGTPLPPWLFDAALVVQRGLLLPELAEAVALERAGIRCCNLIAATRTVWDRAATNQRLSAADLPVPSTRTVTSWLEANDAARERPVVVKAVEVRTGRGQEVLVAPTGELPAQAPFAGPYVVQDLVRNDGRDFKVYVAGRHARGLIKVLAGRPTGEPGVPFDVDAELTDLAHRAGNALGLEIYGVDFVYGSDGPVVIDVNPFPGFRGVAGAAPLIVDHLMGIVEGAAAT